MSPNTSTCHVHEIANITAIATTFAKFFLSMGLCVLGFDILESIAYWSLVFSVGVFLNHIMLSLSVY